MSARRAFHRLALVPIVLFTALSVSACIAPMPTASVLTQIEPSEVREYRIGVPDLLTLTVWQEPDLSGPVLVRRDGKISVPLIGDIHAEGLTPGELADSVRVALGDFFAAPQVDVAVSEMRSQVVSVIGGGAVRSGVVPLQRNTRVIDALATMGGLTPFAKKRKIRILRDTPEGQLEIPFDYVAFIDGHAPTSNIRLEPGDTVVVPE